MTAPWPAVFYLLGDEGHAQILEMSWLHEQKPSSTLLFFQLPAGCVAGHSGRVKGHKCICNHGLQAALGLCYSESFELYVVCTLFFYANFFHPNLKSALN